MTIVLNDAEQKLAVYIAKKRREFNKEISQDWKIGDKNGLEYEIDGAGAELAFCKDFNIYPDLRTDRRCAEDAYLRTGESVDVKSTRYEKGHLIAPLWKSEKPTDLYPFLVGKFPVYRFVGMVSRDDLIREENIQDLGHGDCYVMDQSKVRELDRSALYENRQSTAYAGGAKPNREISNQTAARLSG